MNNECTNCNVRPFGVINVLYDGSCADCGRVITSSVNSPGLNNDETSFLKFSIGTLESYMDHVYELDMGFGNDLYSGDILLVIDLMKRRLSKCSKESSQRMS